MTSMNYAKHIIAAGVVGLMFVLVAIPSIAQAAGGLGISPSRFTVDHMLRGIPAEKTFVLSHGEHSEAKFIKIEVDESIRDWVTTDRGLEFTWPGGSDTQFPLTVIVTPPDDIANGTYTGSIRIINTTDPENAAGGNGASVSLAVAIEGNFTVSDEQVLDYEVHTITTPDQIEEGSPLEMIMHIENKGNVRARPTRVEVDYYDKFNEVLLEEDEVTDMDSVGAFEQDGQILVEVPHTLAVGQYWARILVFGEDGLLKEEDKVVEVVPAGSLAKQGTLSGLEHASSVNPGEVVKITGNFENTGSTIVTARLEVEVYRGSSLVDVLESSARSVRVGKTEELSVFFTPEQAGKYRLEGTVSYSGQVTPTVKSTVNVGGVAGVSGMTIIIIGIIAILVIGVVIFMMRRKGGGDSPDAGSAPGQTPPPTTGAV